MPGIALFGATGKMGRAILPLITVSDDLVLKGAVASPGEHAIGGDAGVIAGIAPLVVVVSEVPDT
jgi:4-hydroxy-tetrahydrodipicolinate reductase